MDGSSKRNDVYERVTNEIIEAIEAGAPEFRMPWHRSGNSSIVLSRRQHGSALGSITGTWLYISILGIVPTMGRSRSAGTAWGTFFHRRFLQAIQSRRPGRCGGGCDDTARSLAILGRLQRGPGGELDDTGARATRSHGADCERGEVRRSTRRRDCLRWHHRRI